MYEMLGDSKNHKCYGIAAKQIVPVMLHTCREARDVASKVYHQAFAARLRNPVYFDFNQDILFGDSNTMILFSQKCNKIRNASLVREERIQRLMISNPRLYLFPHSLIDIHPFKVLKKITIQRGHSSISSSLGFFFSASLHASRF
jgi:hypothetical protein